MRTTHSFGIVLFTLLATLHVTVLFSTIAHAQSGVSGTIQGNVTDPSGAVVPNATVEITNPVSGLTRTTITDNTGRFAIANVPFNPYHVTVTSQGFASQAHDVEVRSAVPVNLDFSLKLT